MLRIGNKVVNASIMEILEKFREYAFDHDIKCFSEIIYKGSDILVTCPNRNHKNMNERNPSCNIANKDIGTVREGTVHCFSCGFKASLDYTLSQCMGIHDDGEFGRTWILENFLNSEEFTRDININLVETKPEQHYVSDEELDKYRYTHPYWQKRKIDEATMIKFDLGYDRQSKSITMPCWDYNGRCIGVTKRKVNSKWFHIPEGVTKPIYLMNFALKEGWKEIYLCESQINALYMNSLGYHACACFGTGSEEQAKDLNRLGIRSVIFCFDGDDAGRKGRARMRSQLSNRIVCSYIELPDGKDMNDLSPEEVHQIVNTAKIF